MTAVAITVTGPESWTRSFAKVLVDDAQAACVHVWKIDSTYRWKDVVHQEPECRAEIHTSASLVPQLRSRVLSEHPYDVPCFVVRELDAGLPEYLAWSDQVVVAHVENA